jgi:hypothetical protein
MKPVVSKPGFHTPLDILGRGYRWPDTPALDRETWQKILWREVAS